MNLYYIFFKKFLDKSQGFYQFILYYVHDMLCENLT